MDIRKEKGFVLVMILLISTILVMLIPSLVFIMRQESKMTVKHKRSSAAFHLAEAGADRGLWKMKENLDIWSQIEDGPIAGYNNDEEYEVYDDDNLLIGTYKIKLTTGATADRRNITATGKDNSGNEVRQVEIIVEMASVTSSVSAPSINFGGSCRIDWGPMTSLGTLTDSTGNSFPRKMARGNIIGYDANGSTPPNDDITGNGHWSWKSYYNVPDPPEIDLAWYLAESQTGDNVYVYGNVGGSAPWKNTEKDHATDPDLIYYITGDCELQNSYLKGALIVIGNLNFKGNGRGAYSADIPSNALDQYQKCAGYPDPADMPGHPGPPGVTTYAVNKVAFEGFIYVGGNLSSSGTPTINGCIVCMGSTAGVGNLTVYYNETVAVSARTATTDMSTVSWEETPAQW